MATKETSHALFDRIQHICKQGGQLSLQSFKNNSILFVTIVTTLCDIQNIHAYGIIADPKKSKDHEHNVKRALKMTKMLKIDTAKITIKDVLKSEQKLIIVLHNLFNYYLNKEVRRKLIAQPVGGCKECFLQLINQILNPDPEVHNFTSDWQTGTNLGALVEHISQGPCPDWREFKANEMENNISNVMDVAMNQLGVKKIIKPRAMMITEAEDDIIIYLSQFLDVIVDNKRASLARDYIYTTAVNIPGRPKPDQTYTTPEEYNRSPQLESADKYEQLQMTPGSQSLPHMKLSDKLPNQPESMTRSMTLDRSISQEPKTYNRRRVGVVEESRSRSAFQQTKDLTTIPMKISGSAQGFWSMMDRYDVFYNRELKASVVDVNLILGRKLGDGHFGDVFMGRYMHPTGGFRMRAVKMLNASRANMKTVQDFLGEAWFAMGTQHENVLHLLEFTFHEGMPCMLLPLYDNRDLKKYLGAHKETSYDQLLDFAIDIASGVKYIIQQNFIHRDLAARNCLVTNELRVVVADFGFTRDILARDYMMAASSKQLPYRWLALEILQGESNFNVQTDVWAMGVVLYEVFSCGEEPYKDIENIEMQLKPFLENNNRLEQPILASNEIYSLMRRCWDGNRKKRPSFETILNDLQLIKQAHSSLDELYDQTIPKTVVSEQGVRPKTNIYTRKQPSTQDNRHQQSGKSVVRSKSHEQSIATHPQHAVVRTTRQISDPHSSVYEDIN